MVNTDLGAIMPDGRRARRARELRQGLYDTAIRLFRERGYEATTVQQITEAVDISKGTFFNYFPSKDHVLAAYHDEMTKSILGTLEAARRSSAEEALLRTSDACARWVAGDVELAGAVVRVVFVSPVLAAADHANGVRFLAWLRGVVDDGIERGELRRDLERDVFVSVMLGTINSAMIEWITEGRAFDLVDTCRRRVALVLRAALDPARTPESAP
ncbi:MAG: TetR/AcrR family transcriptional regulator [Gemmatimonadaceae bacterium]